MLIRRDLARGLLGCSRHHIQQEHLLLLHPQLARLTLRCIHRSGKDVETFVNGCSANYIEGLYTKWKKDPESVDESWDEFFRGGDGASYRKLLRISDSRKRGVGAVDKAVIPLHTETRSASGGAPAAAPAPAGDWKSIDDHHTIQAIIRAYQMRGHLAARLDPLGIINPTQKTSMDGSQRSASEQVLRQHYRYIFNDLNANFKLPPSTRIGGGEEFLPLREILDRLERIYCGHIGFEYMHIYSLSKITWLRDRIEKPNAFALDKDEKKLILERLVRATVFENFLAKKLPSEKRFGLEGCDIMIPVIKEVVDRSTELGIESILIGMAHRGRLNVLANVCHKSISDLLAQFHGLKAEDSGSGDVKYHLGVFQERLNRQTSKMVRITVVANPSHLEYVNPVLLGKARAEMFIRGDAKGNQVLPIIIHGDASFCGQGVVFESMHLSDLPNYTTHGTMHIVANNQVGFTTDPRFSRSSRYCTDVAKVVNAPIFHVNADDPEACINCARIATEYREKFKRDVVIDIVGYRRNGHNEADEPMFTQPLMYQRIRKQKPVAALYSEKLTKEGVITAAEYKGLVDRFEKMFEDGWKSSKELKSVKHSSWIDSPWPGFFEGRDRLKICPTGISMDTMKRIGETFSSPPPEDHMFETHRGIMRILQLRKQMVDEKVADWALGEAFAFGSLLKEGIHVRLSGQDVERGTFSHRHHVLHHQSADKVIYTALQHLYPDQADYSVSNSSLSECAVLGFEHGYSMASPHALVIWEGQFGDFVNTAQCIIDQFIASGETKWVRQSGMVLLLPHSMEGMGPEHSSGRPERFLQLSDDDPDVYPDTCDADFVARQLLNINWIVTNLTTPANLCHALRRQMMMGFRKPLINFSPKSLLRHPMARSPFKDFNECSSFQRIIPDTGAAGKNPGNVKKLVFCSGKVYYDLFQERDDHEQVDKVALVRVEQLCPFPYDLINEQFALYPKAELMWAQEEHKNSGGWSYVQPRFDTALLKNEKETRCVSYHGRPPSSSPATGNKVQHKTEYKDFITSVFGELTPANKKRLADKVKAQQQKAKSASPKDPPKKGGDKPPAAKPAKKRVDTEAAAPVLKRPPRGTPKGASPVAENKRAQPAAKEAPEEPGVTRIIASKVLRNRSSSRGSSKGDVGKTSQSPTPTRSKREPKDPTQGEGGDGQTPKLP